MTDREKVLLTVDEAAERLSLSRTMTYDLVRSGRLPAVKIEDTNQTRIRVSDLNAWVRSLVRAEAERAR